MRGLHLVALGGCCGAVARYLLAGLVQRWAMPAFPLGTLVVNVLGCFAIGAAMGWGGDKGGLGPGARLFVVAGFLGSFTTFSALGYETVALLDNGRFARAAANAVGNYGLGIGAVVLGRLAARAVGA